MKLIEKQNYLEAVKSGFVLIFSAMLISTLAQQFLDRKIEKIIQATTGLSSMIWFWGFLSLITALLLPLIQSLLCSFYLTRQLTAQKNISAFISEHLELSIIETLRACGKSFLWFLLFIIPGFIKYSYYMLTPFVVFFSKGYATGQVDALELSEKIFKRFWIYLSVQLFVFYFILPLLLSTFLDQYRSFYYHPISATLSVAVESFIILFFHYLILKKIFAFLQNEKDLNYVDV